MRGPRSQVGTRRVGTRHAERRNDKYPADWRARGNEVYPLAALIIVAMRPAVADAQGEIREGTG
jgi:hypothetical protein